jgi:hypothetical protein
MFDLQETFELVHKRPGCKYICFKIAMLPNSDRPEVDRRDKIILAQSVLHILSQMNVEFPMLLKLTNAATSDTVTQCAVLDFIAEEGLTFVPAIPHLIFSDSSPIDEWKIFNQTQEVAVGKFKKKIY